MTTPGPALVRELEYPLSTRIAIEALGSFFIVFAGLATALFNPSPSSVAFAYGLALLASMVAFGHITTGYFNPAFSLAMAVAGRIKWLHAVAFIVAQMIGALFSAVVIYALVKVIPTGAGGGISSIFDSLANGYEAHSPSKVPMVGVLVIEVVAMAVLVAVVLGATSARNKTVLAPLAIGVAFAVAVTITLPVSNGSLNPARATAVVFLADSWAAGQLWLFWLAPLFGAAITAALYRTFAPTSASRTLAEGYETLGAELDEDSEPASEVASDSLADDDDAGRLPAPVPAGGAATQTSVDGTSAGQEAQIPETVVPQTTPVEKKNDAQDFFDGPR